MQKKITLISVISCLLFFATIIELARSDGIRILLWQETSAADFEDNLIENLMITNISGGEVRFPEFMQKTVADFQDNGIPRFLSYDRYDNSIRTWIQYGNIFVRKYNPAGDTLSPVLQVNDEAGIAGTSTNVRCALLDNGYFCVVWESTDSPDNNMYCQIFDTSFTKTDTNIIINEIPNYSNYMVNVWGNNSENTFWMLHSLLQGETYKILVQKRDLNARKKGDTFNLNPDNPTVYESQTAVLTDDNGQLIVAWEGTNYNNSDYEDVFIRRYDTSGAPAGPAIKLNDEKVPTWNGQPDLCKDENGNLLVTWSDFRDNTSQYFPYTWAVYGQMLNASLTKLGKNFRINTPEFKNNFWPDVDYSAGEFHVSWRADNNIYTNSWKFLNFTTGAMTSSVFDTGPGGAAYRLISWERDLPAKTTIQFKIRSSKTLNNLAYAPWFGPIDTAQYYTLYSGQEINSVHTHDRFVQYKSFFLTDEAGITPTLRSVTITFMPEDSVSPAKPQGLTASSGHSQIILKWSPNQEPDLAGYQLSRRKAGNVYDNSWMVQVTAGETAYTDSSAVTGTKYFYTLTAIDSSKNVSPPAQEVSATPYGINIYVSSAGTPDGEGTLDKPFPAINQGLQFAKYGDNITVLPGKYHESIELKKGVSVTGSGPNDTELTGTREDYIVKGEDEASLQGFSLIRKSQYPLNAVSCVGTAPLIMDNVIASYVPNSDPAIYCLENARPSLLRNYISGYATGILFMDGSNAEIRNNLIDAANLGIRSALTGKLTIINNTILVHSYCGIELIHGASALVLNNIIIGSTNSIGIRDGNNALTTIYNDVWHHAVNYSGVTAGTGSISADPLFISPGSQNYDLQENSPCRHTGDPGPEYNNTDGTRNHMGVYGGPDPMDASLTSHLVKSISLSHLSGFPGDTVSVFVAVDEPAGIARAEFLLSFDPSILSFIRAATTGTTTGFDLQIIPVSAGIIKCSLSAETAISAGSDSIIQIDFAVDIRTHSGDASQLVFGDLLLAGPSLSPITIKRITNGVFMVNQGSEPGRFVYVDGAAQTPGSGTRQNPYSTIQTAIDQSESGDTIVVAAGIYPEKLIMKDGIYLRGSGAKVTFISPPGDDVGIECPDIQTGELSGFTVRGPEFDPVFEPLLKCTGGAIKIINNRFESFLTPLGGILCSDNAQTTIAHNTIVNQCILVIGSSPDIYHNEITGGMLGGINSQNSSPVITGNMINGGEMGDPGITLTGSGAGAIKHNRFIGKIYGSYGIFLDGAEHALIQNNIFDDQNSDGFGIRIINSSGIEIINNTIKTSHCGVDEENSQLTFYNNIITGNSEFGARFSVSATYDYNDSWNTGENYYQCAPDMHGFSVDPLFADPVNGDFHLNSGSPCIDSGHPDMSYNDWDGTRNDMGAYGGPEADSMWIYADGCRLKADSVEAGAADTVAIGIDGSAISGAARIDLMLTYDPENLNFIDARSTAVSRGLALSKIKINPGLVQIILDGTRGVTENKGKLLDLLFQVKMPEGGRESIHFAKANLSDESLGAITISEMIDGVVTVHGTPLKENESTIPAASELFQNYPNPFNNATLIRYRLAQPVRVTLVIYNLLGQKICTLMNDWQIPGMHDVIWKGTNDHGEMVASGLYFYQIRGGEFIRTRKLLLLK